MATEPPWFKTLTAIDRQQAEKLRRTWRARARSLLDNRPNNKDENLFLAATSAALLGIDSSQYSTTNPNNSLNTALLRWKEIAWQSSDPSSLVQHQANAHFHPRSTEATAQDAIPDAQRQVEIGGFSSNIMAASANSADAVVSGVAEMMALTGGSAFRVPYKSSSAGSTP